MTDTGLWFTRVTLRRNSPDIAPLVRRLFPENAGEGERSNATHQLLWTLMPEEMQQAGKPGQASGGGDRAAFLWREAAVPDTWYLLGPKVREQSPFFEVDEPKPYGLALKPGDRLAFDMVASATVDRMIDPSKGRAGRKRCDLVLDALKAQERGGQNLPPRAVRRADVATETLSGWLAGQGERNGFTPDTFDLVSYRSVEIDRPRAQRKNARVPLMGVGHMRGTLTVQEPTLFATKVMAGFGRSKAFGCGLMLLRRVP